ncbi:MAG: heparinase II/III family protein [Ferruginibacter sp.]
MRYRNTNSFRQKAMHFTCKIFSVLIILCATANHLTAQKAHPYLYFTPAKMQQLKDRIQKDTIANRSWNEMKESADKAVLAGKGGNMEELCLAYRMTGDTKYGEPVKALLLQLVNKAAWDGLDDRTPRWNSALGTARQNGLAANAFDCIYDILSKAERKGIADKIVKLGIEPSISDWISADKRIHTLNSMGHNWWSAIVYQAGVASLAVMNEVPQAKQWANDVLNASKEWFAFSGSVLENKVPNFDPSGGFYESVSYANFGVSEYLAFRLAWTNSFAPIQMAYDKQLEKTMDWFINAGYPTSERLMSLNFGDSNPFSNGDRPVKLMIELGFGKDRYYWYLNETKKGKVNEDMNINTPFGLVYSPAKTTGSVAPDLPLSAMYSTMGWGMLRSSWDKDATFLGVKCGYTWNHSHADAGSFVLYHRGKNLLIDGGDVNYGLPEYSSYFVRSEAHNVLLFNGMAQTPEDQYHAVKNPGHIYNLIDGGAFKYILADAQGPTSRFFLRNYRNFIWIGDVILVIDDVKTYEPGKLEWLLHYDKDAKKKGLDIEVSNENATILVRPLFPETLPNGYPHDFPEKMKIEERQGVKDRDAKTKISYYAFSPAEASRQTKFVNAIILLSDKNKPIEGPQLSSMASAPEARTNLPKIEKLEGKDMIGVRITQNGKVTDVYINLLADGRLMHRNSTSTFNGWETDAYMMAVSYPENKAATTGNAIEYFISNGSYLKRNGQVILNSLSKVFMHVKIDGKIPEIILQGQPVMNVNLLLKDKSGQVMINNKKQTPVYKQDGRTLVIESAL